jgi:hypothetical protein
MRRNIAHIRVTFRSVPRAREIKTLCEIFLCLAEQGKRRRKVFRRQPRLPSLILGPTTHLNSLIILDIIGCSAQARQQTVTFPPVSLEFGIKRKRVTFTPDNVPPVPNS